jgi:D-hydroxyproline dehydrogenase subunit gamma
LSSAPRAIIGAIVSAWLAASVTPEWQHTVKAPGWLSDSLLVAGIEHCRTTPVTGAPRLPYCLMGVCFDCLVTIDGVGSRQACLVPVQEGMRVETQIGKREAGR